MSKSIAGNRHHLWRSESLLCGRARVLTWLVVLGLMIFALYSQTAQAAGTRRYAVVVGANVGDVGEETLRYAEHDAERVAEVMRRLAGVYEEDLVLLRSPNADGLERVLRQVVRRIDRDVRSGEVSEALLFFYYSGHADATTLHLQGDHLPFRRLKRLVNMAPVTVRLLVMDACRSGDITRIKGAVPAKPFEIQADDRLDAEGLAIITSSAAGEDAQESERLQGGIFTHHFVNGLLGAADTTGDARVTLTEAYMYGYIQTLRSTSRARFVQHPTYSFQMEGRDELVLTQLGASRELGQLRLDHAGTYVVLQGRGSGRERSRATKAAGRVVAEVVTVQPASLALPPGSYLVRRRSDNAAHETRVEVSAGHVTTVAVDDMTEVPFGPTVRKGYRKRRRVAMGLLGDFSVGGPLRRGLGVGLFGAAGLRLDFEPLTLQVRARYGRYQANNEQLAIVQDMVGGDLALLKMFDIRRFSPGLGVRTGVDWISQRFATQGVAPDRRSWAWRGGPVLRAEYAPVARLQISIEGGADIYVLPVASASGNSSLSSAVVPYGSIGLGVYLF